MPGQGGSSSGSRTSGGDAAARAEEKSFKALDSKLIPTMPSCKPESWSSRPQEIVGFQTFVESLTSWLCTLAPDYYGEVECIMEGREIPRVTDSAVVERSRRLCYVSEAKFCT